MPRAKSLAALRGRPARSPSALENAAAHPRAGFASLGARAAALVHTTVGLGLAGSALLWAALPPVDWWPLAWVAPVPWLMVVRSAEGGAGRHPYRALWLAGLAFWLAALHWLRLPHPVTSIGWLALASYLGCYLPLFVGLVRVAVHQLGVSVVLAAPVVWTGLELAQAHLLTGFSMAHLGHTQYRWIWLIQLADLAGEYGVGFVVMCGAACLARMWPCDGRRWAAWPLMPACAVLGAALVYGELRTAGEHSRGGLKVALVQGSVDTQLKADPRKSAQIEREYRSLSEEAVRRHADLDLIVWPETMFRDALLTLGKDVVPPTGAKWTKRDLEFDAHRRLGQIRHLALELGTPLLLGIDTLHFRAGTIDHYNSALAVTRDGKLAGRYDKMHLVMFGEYVPLARRFPWLYNLTPLGGGLDAGRAAQAFEVAGARLAPNICYESTLPHVIRSGVRDLGRRGQEPDVLVNLTNDGWFWGSSELDLHLMCGVFRAVECRKPFLVAANTGFSAWIDADGRILGRGPRRARGIVVADVRLDTRTSPYVHWGDWPAGVCLLFSLVLAGAGARRRFATSAPGAEVPAAGDV